MIPLRIRLTNFLSHAETDIPFAGLHAAVLTGHNGSGKSSILDAITWVLWGVARSAGDSVVRLGETECAVDLVLELGGVEYTVRRRRSTHKGVATSLEFFAGTTPLTKSGVRETQAAITATLRMDYETFVASAFLAQGKSDVFTASTPKARKELLGEILGLSRYDVLATAAREAMKTAQAKADLVEASRARLLVSVEAIGPATEHLTFAEEGRIGVSMARKAEEDNHAALVARDAEMRAAEAEVERHNTARREADMRAEVAAMDIKAHEARTQASMLAVIGAPDAQARHAEWQGLSLLEAGARVKADAWLVLDRQASDRRNAGITLVASLHAELSARTASLVATRRAKQDRLAALQAEQVRAPELEKDRAVSVVGLAALDALAAEFEAVRDEGSALASENADASAAVTVYQRDADNVAIRILKIEASLATAANGAPCPTCAQSLSEGALRAMLTDLRSEREEFLVLAEKHLVKVVDLEAAIAGKRVACENMRDQLRVREIHQRVLATADAQLAALDVQASEVLALTDELAANIPDMRSKDLAEDINQAENEAHTAVCLLNAERDAIGHDATDYALLRARLAEMADAPAKWETAQAALLDLEKAKNDVARLEADLANYRETARKAAEASLEAQAKASGAAGARAALTDAELAVTRLRASERESMQQIAEIRATLTRLDMDAKELDASAATYQAALDVAGDYKHLALAFGRNGIQAQAVESAIPEIEQEANRLLADLGDNHTRVSLVTQRDLKGGGTAETLDVCIADDAGERPYESYSGGEAFRVNFALRLALSRLLARRSGAPLQMLVIDEGFGTQDESGRVRLLQAINAVAPEFRLILIVTHIKELKDAFNSQIEVTKRDGVSSVRLVA